MNSSPVFIFFQVFLNSGSVFWNWVFQKVTEIKKTLRNSNSKTSQKIPLYGAEDRNRLWYWTAEWCHCCGMGPSRNRKFSVGPSLLGWHPTCHPEPLLRVQKLQNCWHCTQVDPRREWHSCRCCRCRSEGLQKNLFFKKWDKKADFHFGKKNFWIFIILIFKSTYLYMTQIFWIVEWKFCPKSPILHLNF